MKQGTVLFPAVDLKDGRKLTLACVKETTNIAADEESKPRLFHLLKFGYSVKNPNDDENQKLGNLIAEGRAVKTPFFVSGVHSKGVSKLFLNNLAKLLQDEFEHRFGNYITTSSKIQSREVKVEPS